MIVIKRVFIPYTVVCILFLLSSYLFSPIAWAGNKTITEERVEELDTVNKQVIEQIPDVPENGSLAVTAKVLNKEWTVDYTTTEDGTAGKETKSGTITFSSDQLGTTETKEDTINFGSNQQETSQPERGQEEENEHTSESN